jgi:glycosyltransferase involved in cell wall biosynthesis
MKIGFISTVHGHQWPGSEYIWAACAEQLLAQKHEVLACVSVDLRSARPLQDLQGKGVAVHFVERSTGRIGRIRQKYFNPLNKLQTASLDQVIISAGSPYDPIYWPVLGEFLRTTRVPFIFIGHFNAETFWVDDGMRSTMKEIFEKAAASVFVCLENYRLAERQLGCAIPNVTIIAEPLQANLPEPLPWPERKDNQPWRLACVARLEPRWKGQDVLFEILADSKWKERNYLLNLFGQGAEEGYLRRLCKHYGLENQVKFAGYTAPENIWREHHIQILATRGEGGPMVITEGMMCGRAAITTRCGFNGDYIHDGQNGFLADFAVPECFGRKMEEAWNRREEWKAMGVQAHNSIKQRLDDFKAPERLLKLILENHKPT